MRLLAPVRDVVARFLPPAAGDEAAVLQHYLELARLGLKVGRKDGADAARRLAPEMGNLEAILLPLLANSDPGPGIEAAIALADFVRLTGLGSIRTLEAALEAARKTTSPAQEARCLEQLGRLALERRDLETAASRYKEALSVFVQIADQAGEADCIEKLGHIARRRSDWKLASTLYEQALANYRSIGSPMGEAGEANAIINIGDVAFHLSDLESAGVRYREALALFRQLRDPLGEASCIMKQGELQRRRSQLDDAGASFKGALSIYRRIGDLRGQAACLIGLGEVEKSKGSAGAASKSFEQALHLYSQLADPYNVGYAHRQLAGLAAPASHERLEHLNAALLAWKGIDRADLLAALESEIAAAQGVPQKPSPRSDRRQQET